MDRSHKEHNLKYFKSEKFVKGSVVINIKAKIEELYIIEKGKLALVIPNNFNKHYTKKHIVFAILEPGQIFNEYPLVLEKESPYYVVCVEDTELLSLDKNNLTFISDNETLQDLRANSQGKERLLMAYIEKLSKLKSEAFENNQKSLFDKLKVNYKFFDDIFNKENLKGTTSNHYLKNLEKFNSVLGRGNDSKNVGTPGFNGTPKLESKNPNFNALGADREKSMQILRMQGMSLRVGVGSNQTNLNEINKEEVTKIKQDAVKDGDYGKTISKGSIGDSFNMNTPRAEEQKSAPKSFLRKMQQGNEELLSKFQIPKRSSENAQEETKIEQVLQTPPLEVKIENLANKIIEETQNLGEKESKTKPIFDADKIDEIGLKMTKRNLSTIVMNKLFKPLPETITTRVNKLKNFN